MQVLREFGQMLKKTNAKRESEFTGYLQLADKLEQHMSQMHKDLT